LSGNEHNVEKTARVVDLIDQLRTIQEKADDLATEQNKLKQQLVAAVDKAHELHQKILEERNDLGGQG
jgi:uncharacterized coiled-coil DUF342 family protein